MCSHVEISLVLEIKTVKVLTHVKSEVVRVCDEESCHEDTVEGVSVALCFINFVELDGRLLPSSFSDHFTGGESTTSMPMIHRWLSIRADVDTVGKKLIYLLHQFDPSLSL